MFLISISTLAAAARWEWPSCQEHDTVIRNAGRALFMNLLGFGAEHGCFHDDCTMSDKFATTSLEACINLCHTIPECAWWSFGSEEGMQKCWLRVADDGREVASAENSAAKGFVSGAKTCVHPEVRELDIGNRQCWIDGFEYDTCCDPKFGPQGNQQCWDGLFNWRLCCFPEVEQLGGGGGSSTAAGGSAGSMAVEGGGGGGSSSSGDPDVDGGGAGGRVEL